ncbi:ParA family protein [Nitrosophilus labii]|uniref:ParA family protein n=1 Tax=Nitrosophilus labii TaxID=2706014 RepID=UPI0016573E59|nr:ParA family protein [Nitrosophilus labii]
MQKVITIAHQKGGVGKSTIALNLAVELGKKYPLSVIDLDYQKSISIFNENRKEVGLNPLNIISVESQKELMNIIDNADGIILIDSGGFDSDLNRIAILGADIIITPLSNNLIEIYGLEAFKKILIDLKRIRSDIKSNILLNNVNPQITKSIEELKEYIKSNSQFFNIFETILRRRVDFAKSFETGKSVVEIDRSSKASKEIDSLISEIELILQKY